MERLTTLSDYVASLEIMSAKEYQSIYGFDYAYEDDVSLLIYDGGHIVANENGTFTLNLYNQSFHSAHLNELEELLWDGYGKWEGQCLTEDEMLVDLTSRIQEFQEKYNLPSISIHDLEPLIFDSEECVKRLEYLRQVDYDLLDFIKAGE